MKLGPREAPGYLARPDPARAGLLIYGADAMRVALKRQQAVAALVGPEGEAEMRLTRISGAELRRDPALLADAVNAIGFFPGTRVALVDEAGEGNREAVAAALDGWQHGRCGAGGHRRRAGQVLGPAQAVRDPSHRLCAGPLRRSAEPGRRSRPS